MNDDDDDDDLLSLSSSFLLLLKKKYLFNHIFFGFIQTNSQNKTKTKQNKVFISTKKNGSKVNQATEFVYENKKICLLYE